MPINIDGKREKRVFRNKDDVWQVVDLLVEEVRDFNDQQGKDFEVSESLIAQIPFFACPNVFLDPKIFRDIQKYIYCEKFGVAPYEGSYGKQPYKWVDRSFAIKSALAKKEKKDINGQKSKHNTGKI